MGYDGCDFDFTHMTFIVIQYEWIGGREQLQEIHILHGKTQCFL